LIVPDSGRTTERGLTSARGSRRALVGTRQPLAQLAGGFVRCGPVKRHQRRRDPGDANDTGAPAILGNRGHLDEVGPARDGFLEMMYGGGHDSLLDEKLGKVALILRVAGARTSEGRREN